jgi:hypothetical protein
MRQPKVGWAVANCAWAWETVDIVLARGSRRGMDGSPGTNAYDHLMKILIIGDSGSNKRRLLGKYLQDEELTDTTTLGVHWP